MARCALGTRVFFFEPARFHSGNAELEVTHLPNGPWRVVPRLSDGTGKVEAQSRLQRMVSALLVGHGVKRYACWYSTPAALAFTRRLRPELVVYDALDVLPVELAPLERELFGRADVVFTGGESAWRARRNQHHDVHAFPSSIDAGHFALARTLQREPEEQRALERPRLGCYGLGPEAMDLELVARVAAARPGWQLVMLAGDGPNLPHAPNLHWLGVKPVEALPAWISGWDAAWLPFSREREPSSPPQPAELIAAGRPVVATPVTDVVKPYGELELLRLATDVAGVVAAVEQLQQEDVIARRHRADAFLAAMSWDMTWHRMSNAIEEARARKTHARAHAA